MDLDVKSEVVDNKPHQRVWRQHQCSIFIPRRCSGLLLKLFSLFLQFLFTVLKFIMCERYIYIYMTYICSIYLSILYIIDNLRAIKTKQTGGRYENERKNKKTQRKGERGESLSLYIKAFNSRLFF